MKCFNVHVSYRANKTPAQDPIREVDRHQLNENPLLRHHCSVEVKNRYDASLEENDTEADYGYRMESITTIALELLPKKQRKENPHKDPNIEHHCSNLQLNSDTHRTAPYFSTKEKLEDVKIQLDELHAGLQPETHPEIDGTPVKIQRGASLP